MEIGSILIIEHALSLRELRKIQIAAGVDLKEDRPLLRGGDVPLPGADPREDGRCL
jgi:hypothetical protein